MPGHGECMYARIPIPYELYELEVTLYSEVCPFSRVAAHSLGMRQRSPHEADVVSEPHPVGAITGLCRYVGRISVENWFYKLIWPISPTLSG